MVAPGTSIPALAAKLNIIKPDQYVSGITATDFISSTGDASIALDTMAIPFISASVSGSSMMTSSNTSTETLTNYATEQSVDAGITPAPYTLTSRGTVDSSQLDNVNVRVELDSDGDGVVDVTVDTTWDALTS